MPLVEVRQHSFLYRFRRLNWREEASVRRPAEHEGFPSSLREHPRTTTFDGGEEGIEPPQGDPCTTTGMCRLIMVGTRNEWLAARLTLLEAEKEHTRRGDEVARMRQELPWFRIEKDYQFETNEGDGWLSDLFRGRSQLLVYHLIFGPDYTTACPSCSAIADGFNGIQIHLANAPSVNECIIANALVEARTSAKPCTY